MSKTTGLLERKFSFYKAPIKNVFPEKSIDLTEFMDLLLDSDLRRKTEELRALSDSKSARDFKSTNFPYVTFCGEFKKRSNKDIISKSGFICMDLDHLGDDIERIKKTLEEDTDHLILYFTSPSGDGLKIVYPIDIDQSVSHEDWYKAYSNYLREITGINDLDVDPKCKDLGRACFVPYDDTYFYNPRLKDINNQPAPIDVTKYLESSESYESYPSENDGENSFALQFGSITKPDGLDVEEQFKYHLIEYEKKNGVYGRPRRIWILGFASRCRSYGIEYDDCKRLALKYYPNNPNSHSKSDPFDIDEHLLTPIDDAYNRYPDQFGTKRLDSFDKIETPYLEEIVFEKVHPTLSMLSSHYTARREKDIVLLGLLISLSAALPNVFGYYGGDKVGPNLYLFVSAPPASGKGRLTTAAKGAFAIHESLKRAYDEQLPGYEHQMKLFNEGELETEPEKPVRKKLIIPGNSSSSSILRTLRSNDGRGFFFETEADTISNTIMNDWGNFSDILRKIFQHEPITQGRVSDDGDVEIMNPYCSVLLSGTPDQLPKFLKGVDNGLFSRFLFYTFSHDFKWQDVFASNYSETLADSILHIEGYFREIHSYLITREEEIEFTFSSSQKIKFNHILEEWSLDAIESYGDSARATVVRLGLCFFRMAMTISLFEHLYHKLHNNDKSDEKLIECTDQNFEVVESIMKTLKSHGLLLLSRFKKFKNLAVLKSGQQQNFYDVLKNEFTTKEYRDAADLIKLSHKTAEKYINDYIKLNVLERVNHGQYKKSRRA